MTREEAIEYLKDADVTVYHDKKTKTAEALEMAIEALQTEPCEDAISRRSVLKICSDYYHTTNIYSITDVAQKIKALPSVNPQKVIRCKDCILCREDDVCGDLLFCDRLKDSFIVYENGFCAWAKMEEGDKE